MKPEGFPDKPPGPLKAASLPVAVLALLVVVVSAVAAVGMITGPFSYPQHVDGTRPPGSPGTIPLSRQELSISGSTTMRTISESLAEAFMEKENCSVTVKGGGSGAGISSAGMGIVDIGSASRAIKEEEMLKYPDLQVHTIGGSAVVVILNGIEGSFTEKNELIKAFNDADGKVGLTFNEKTGGLLVNQAGTAFRVFQRADESGTEETFAAYLGLGENLDCYGAEGRLGNEGVLAAVEDTQKSIGFVDFGFAKKSQVVSIAGVESYTGEEINEENIRAALTGNAKPFPSESSTLIRPLNYLTKGKPDAVEQKFIDFAQSPAAKVYFEKCGYFSVSGSC